MTKAKNLPYRPCVGILLFNREGRVWIGRRVPQWQGDGSRHMWQMPQGGIDKGETPQQAALRELGEEIGSNQAEIMDEHPDWLSYDLPDKALGVALGGKFRGQRQKWFAMRFLGEDGQISIDGSNGHPVEFDQWRWADINELAGLVVAFKRPIYESVVARFQPLIAGD